ncbi:MAG: type IV pilus assembly protein PilM [Candidatus Buchananbacteria bacterium]|nr:type IV pilus assembly protein PilM [Candidatus Buchananbacteria bacterium]
MGLFSKTVSYLGVDIGTSSIKIVELTQDHGRPRLVTYGFTERRFEAVGQQPSEAEIATAIQEICGKSRTTTTRAITSLPNFSVFSSIITLPDLNKKELASAISWEAKKLIPTPLEDIILDWKIIGDAPLATTANSTQATAPKRIFSKPKKNLRILLTGASKALVNRYITIFNQAELTLLSLETENFALIRSLVGADESTQLLVDLGASTSSITVVDHGVPVMSRSLEVGGLMITRAVSSSLNVSLDRAEQFKQDLSLDIETAENSLPQTVEKSFATILNEVRYTIEQYHDQNQSKIGKIILTGGGSLLGHLGGYIETKLNINTYVGDPWARIVYPTDLKPVLDRIGPRFAVAVGLALRNLG